MLEGAWRFRMALCIGLAFFVALFASCGGRRQSRTAPPAKPVTIAPGVSIFPATPAGHAADAAVQAARRNGPGAETAYQASLQQLRSHGAEATNALVAGYRSADPADYGTRALVVEILAELQQPEALPALTAI